jgi:hypothetical protein
MTIGHGCDRRSVRSAHDTGGVLESLNWLQALPFGFMSGGVNTLRDIRLRCIALAIPV